MRGYFGIGIENGKAEVNLGTLWRSAHIFGAAFIFTVGRRYQQQSSDVKKSWRSIPLFNFPTLAELKAYLPFECLLVGVELIPGIEEIENFTHPERAVYLLGSEDRGLSKEALEKCHRFVRLPGNDCLNVAVAGSIVMYDRLRQWKLNGKSVNLPSWGDRRNGKERIRDDEVLLHMRRGDDQGGGV